MNDTITILMATYNGGNYLQQQLESILQQTYTNWRLVIRDDHSSDNTAMILDDYQKNHPEKITILKDDLSNLGSTKNFEQLIQHGCTADYIMFADQDDYWLPNKIELTFSKMQLEENRLGKEVAILVFTDFRYVDNDLTAIPAKETFTVYNREELFLPTLLAQNPAYGCTMMLNKKLIPLVSTIPSEAENHDYWVALVASLFGKIFYLADKTIWYRQHGGNISGAHNDSSFLNRIKINLVQKGKLKLVSKRIRMLKVLQSRYGKAITTEQNDTINAFNGFAETKRLSLLRKNLRNGVRKSSIGQTAMLYLNMFLINKEFV